MTAEQVAPAVRTDRFVAEIKRSAVDRVFVPAIAAFALVLTAVLVVLVLLASVTEEPGYVLLLSPSAIFVLVMLVAHAYTWGATRSIEWPLQVDPRGLVFCTPRGRVELPWEAVTQVSMQRRLFFWLLWVRVHPDAGPGAPGVVSTLPNASWRVVRRSGLRLSLRMLTCGGDEVAAAVAYFSGGRFTPAPPR